MHCTARCCVSSRTVSTVAKAIVLLAVAVGTAASQPKQSAGAQSSDTTARPLMLDSDEGESRIRRVHTDSSASASSEFILKVSPKNNGSQHLVVGTEVLAPGAALPKHRHLVQDEVLLIKAEPPTHGSAIRSATSILEGWCSSQRTPGSAGRTSARLRSY